MTRHQVARIRFIRQRQTYTVKELAELLEVHPRTVHQWHAEGLMALEESRPLLFSGYYAKTYLKTRLAQRRQKLGPGEFFCMRCRRPRMSPSEKLKSSLTGKRIGKDRELVLLYGECSVCGCKMVRFTTQQAPNGRVFPLMPEVAEGR